MHGESKYTFKCNVNEIVARFELLFDKDWIQEAGTTNWTETNLLHKIEGTNYWAVNPTNGTVGELTSATWVWNGNTWTETTYYQEAVHPFLGSGDVNGWKDVAAEIALVIAGDPAFTNDVVVKFTVSATDKDTGEPIPAADITVGGASVTNGVAWQSHKEHTTNDVTPVITGHANWTAELGATVIRWGFSSEDFSFLGTNPNPGGGCADPLDELRAVLKTNMNTTILTNGQSVPVLIGARVELKMSDMNGTTGHQWVIPERGLQFRDDQLCQQRHQCQPRQRRSGCSKANKRSRFCLVENGNHLVEAKCKLMGKDLTAKFRFIVDEPAIPVFVNPAVPPPLGPFVYGQVGVGTTHKNAFGVAALYFGLGNATNYGIGFQRGTGGYGEYEWWQVVNSSSITMVTNGVTTNTTTSGVDGDIPYDTKIGTSDSPAVVLKTGASSYTVKDDYSMYLMYRPGPGEIWVPFRQFNWKWEGTATNGNSGWGLATNSVTTPTGSFTATNYPGWSRQADKTLLP